MDVCKSLVIPNLHSVRKALKQNLEALIVALKKAKPASAKGQYVKAVSLSTTMGPGLKIDQASLNADN